MSQITLDNVVKRFGSVVAVDHVSLTIAEGEFVALLGPSGCGKTTTLRLIAGLEIADEGRITIGDRDVTYLAPAARDVAMVFQDYALYPHMTILDNIGYPLKVRGVSTPERTARVTEVARELQIGDLLARRPSQLSGGQQQRASVARAVVHQAVAFLFDEPLSNLDAQLRLEARAFLKHLQNELGATSVYVTHDQAEAMALADRIVVMRLGKIMQVGAPLEVYRNPANTFVASFIGSPPMNLLSGKVLLGQGQFVLDDGETVIDMGQVYQRLERPPQDGQAITLGIRPEHITIHTEPRPFAIPGALYVVQPMGGETLVNVRVGSKLVTVRLFQDEPPALPEKVWLEPALEWSFVYGADGARLQ
ncbi:MAG: ABC transporter ATP-binding protein [Anaerolineae bacterium]|nr:ABC transporter ATP-binding protein [Anaerolineae bacterium]